MWIKEVFIAYCFETEEHKDPKFDGILFSFNKESVEKYIEKDIQSNTNAFKWQYSTIKELICDDATVDKISGLMSNEGCGWISENNNYKFYPMPDKKKYVAVIKNDKITGYAKRY